jgi:hypothetical protein
LIELRISDSEKQSQTNRRQLTVSDEVSISIAEEESDDLLLADKLENQEEGNDSILDTEGMTRKEIPNPYPYQYAYPHPYPFPSPQLPGYWALHPQFGIPVFIRQ